MLLYLESYPSKVSLTMLTVAEQSRQMQEYSWLDKQLIAYQELHFFRVVSHFSQWVTQSVSQPISQTGIYNSGCCSSYNSQVQL
jgi:hypothetical protein